MSSTGPTHSYAESTPEVSELPVEDRTELQKLIAEVIENHGLWCETVAVTGSHQGRALKVVLDEPEGTEPLTLDVLTNIAEEISELLDELGDNIPELGAQAFDLEVTSPGTSRPLVRPRHFRRNIGRLVETHATQGETARQFQARIMSVGEESVELAEIKPGAKKGMPAKQLPAEHYYFGVLSNTRVQVELTK